MPRPPARRWDDAAGTFRKLRNYTIAPGCWPALRCNALQRAGQAGEFVQIESLRAAARIDATVASRKVPARARRSMCRTRRAW